jgi:pyridoxine 4-dehydrogenase
MHTMTLIGKQVSRIGYGTMRLPGDGVMGPPKDHGAAISVLRRAVELGVKVIDTAWYYGPDVANELLAEALRPYADDLIIVTKLGGKRDDAGGWLPANAPDELRAGMERDLRLLKLECVPIVHLRLMSPELDDTFMKAVETMLTMQREGKLQHLGLSTVTMPQLDYVLERSPVATVSNAYSLQDRHDQLIVERCAREGIAYLPYFPLAVGKAGDSTVLQEWAEKLGVTPSQVALAWLLQSSPTMLPIPGTSSVAHLEENVAAGELVLPAEAVAAISRGS